MVERTCVFLVQSEIVLQNFSSTKITICFVKLENASVKLLDMEIVITT